MRYKGIVHITGEHDTGKTLMALGACHPKSVVFFHDDTKVPEGMTPNDFGKWVDLTEQRNLTYMGKMGFVLDIIHQIQPGQYDGIVFDTWSRTGAAIVTHGKVNAAKFRESNTMASGQVYRWGQEWNEGRWYEASIISEMSKLAPYVCLVTHLKDHYLSNRATGKEVPDCSKTLNRVCNFRVWLRHNVDSGVPIALVLKRIAGVSIMENGVEVINLLPRRLKPLPDEKSVWDIIDRYRQEPFGNRQPTEDETPTPFELSILDGILTEGQKEIWRTNVQLGQEEDLLAETERDEVTRKVRVMSSNGRNLDDIIQAIQTEYNNNYDFSDIVEMIG